MKGAIITVGLLAAAAISYFFVDWSKISVFKLLK